MIKNTPITLIKLGGSIITNKEVPYTTRPDVLKRLVQEIARARSESNELFIVGHGQGSFAHAPALRYQTMDGFVNKDSIIGMAITQDSAAQLNRIVVKQFIDEHLPAASFLFSNSMVTSQDVAKHWCSQVLLEYLDKGLLPICCGDVIVDDKKGCTIWSTEKILAYLALELPKHSLDVSRVIHVTEVAGVLDSEGATIPSITSATKDDAKQHINGTKGFDVTGGMWHKIEESLELATKGITSHIIAGGKTDNLYNCLMNKKYEGTVIEQ